VQLLAHGLVIDLSLSERINTGSAVGREFAGVVVQVLITHSSLYSTGPEWPLERKVPSAVSMYGGWGRQENSGPLS
jgi:hypothetical protein